MLPIKPEGPSSAHEITFAKDQPEYLPLPALTDGTNVWTTWKLSWVERINILLYGKLHLRLLTFGRPLQPICLSVLPIQED